MYAGRIRMLVRYDGTDFSGSQFQPGKRTVQGTLKAELERITGQDVHLVFASRTDSGVHADGNVCACDLQLPFAPERLTGILNKRLPPDLQIRNSGVAAAGFNPRYEARSRTYVYRLYRGDDIPVDRKRYVWACPGSWDGQLVEAGLRRIVGRRSFHRFAAGSLQPERAVCDLTMAEQMAWGAELIWTFSANRFLRSMVCRLVGALASLARAKLSLDAFEAALDGQQALQFKPAPPRGLVLTAVTYAGDGRESGEER